MKKSNVVTVVASAIMTVSLITPSLLVGASTKNAGNPIINSSSSDKPSIEKTALSDCITFSDGSVMTVLYNDIDKQSGVINYLGESHSF